MEDEIDLRKYIDVIIRHWRLIVIITGAAVVIATLVTFISPPVYRATASVLITESRAKIVLVPEYQNQPPQESSGSMRQALLALAKSPVVAGQVIKQMEDELEPNERNISNLLAKIDIGSTGDLVTISAKSTNPQKAAAIANIWTEYYKRYVNDLYSGLLQSSGELKAQADTAEKEYKEKQKAVEDFIKDNHIDELYEQINDKEILYDARLLREHMESSSSSAASSTANSLALMLLQTKAFTTLPAGLQVSLNSSSVSNATTASVDALIATLEARAGGKQKQSLAELQQDIRLLQAELEQEKARQRESAGTRDIAWNAYTTIAGKIVETDVAAQAQGGVVKVARFADVPVAPSGSRKAVNICIALVLGAIVGIFTAFGLEYFSKPRKKAARPKTKS